MRFQKYSRIEVFHALDHLWEKDYGISIHELTKRFQEHLNYIEATAQHAEFALKQVYKSRSWRITQPLRWGTHQIRILRERGIKSRLIAFLKRIFYPPLRILDNFIISKLLKKEGLINIFIFKVIFKKTHKLICFILGEHQDYPIPTPDQITSRTHQIYSDIVSSKKNNNKKND